MRHLDYYTKDTTLLWRLWRYFRQGHSVYLAFAVSMLNFVVIQYELILKNISILNSVIPNILYFALLFVLVYPALAIAIGYKDMKKGSWVADSEINFDLSPRLREMYERIEEMSGRMMHIERKISELTDKKHR